VRIAYITAGAAGMLCGSCLHDNTLAAALMSMGEDVALIPTYTPIRTDETDVSLDRVFYGAVNVWLEQKSALSRWLPRPVRRLLDRPGLLEWASSRGVSIDAAELGDMTLSVLQGEKGKQQRELDELVAWLRDDYHPDIVHITNSMLLGLAAPIKRELDVPVLCSLQGEDLFLDDLVEPYRTRVHRELRQHAEEVDALIATSDYYADFMAEYLDVDRERVRVVRLGINLEGHGEPGSGDPGGDTDSVHPGRPFVVGYLARIAPEKGLHLLAEAFALLAAVAAGDDGGRPVELRAAGWLGDEHRPYLEEVRRRLEERGLGDAFRYEGEVSREEKIRFLQGLDVLSVPTVYREPKGLFVLEALANGVPVVEPAHGSFPEMIEATGGGLLVEPDSAEDLSRALDVLRRDPERARALGRVGRQAVTERFTDRAMAESTHRLYREWVGEPAGTTAT